MVSNMVKISIFGAGGTGGSLAQMLAYEGFREVALIDVAGEMAEGKALDIDQAGALTGQDGAVIGGNDPGLSRESDIVVITAGIGRKPGIRREDLLQVNGDIIREISEQVRVSSPNAFVIVLTNPADILTRIAIEATGFGPTRVVGQGGILDSARLSTHIAHRLGISQTHVRSIVLGGHGDHMVPIRRFASVNGVPVEDLMSREDFDAAIERTRYGGGEILGKFGTHGAAVTPARSVLAMIHALLSPAPQLLPIATRAGGAYGLPEDVVIGLPALVSRNGVERVLELPIAPEERTALVQSASTMNDAYAVWKQRTG